MFADPLPDSDWEQDSGRPRNKNSIIHRSSVPRPLVALSGDGYETIVEQSTDQLTETSLLLTGKLLFKKKKKSSFSYQDAENGDNFRTSDYCSFRAPTGHRRVKSVAEALTEIQLSWSGVTATVYQYASGLCGRQYRTGQTKEILQNVSGIAKPGHLMGILGASGSGKTTLLNVLSGQQIGNNVSVMGSVKLNGHPLTDNMKLFIAYSQQEDEFLPTLKVKEHIWFHALLRMDPQIPLKDRGVRVKEILLQMGLLKCADTLIGRPGTQSKGISGGEMKRLSVACEVLSNPPILMCDEPTSGLDAFMALAVVKMFRKMARQGKTILITMHQPSSEVFRLLDDLLLMSQGRFAYLGPARKAMDFFSQCGFPCPEHCNPADHYIHHLSAKPGTEAKSQLMIDNIIDSYWDTSEYREISISIRDLDLCRDPNISRTCNSPDYLSFVSSKFKSHALTQIRVLVWRAWKVLWRNRNLSITRIIQTSLMALIIGLVFIQDRHNPRSEMNINSGLFFILTSMTFNNALAVLNSFPNELKMIRHESSTGCYRVSAYYVAKNLTELGIFTLIPTIYVAIVYFLIGFRAEVNSFLVCWLILWLVTQIAVAFGYLMSTLFGRVDLCLAFAPVIIQCFLYLGGFQLNLKSLAGWLSWTQYLSWFRIGFEALLVNQWDGFTSIACANTTQVDAVCFGSADEIYQFYGMQGVDVRISLAILLFMGLIYHALSLVCFYKRSVV